MADILEFPVKKIKSAENVAEEFADEMVKRISRQVMIQIASNKNLTKPERRAMVPSVKLVEESVRSLVLKSYNLHHPYQDMAEEFFNPKTKA